MTQKPPQKMSYNLAYQKETDSYTLTEIDVMYDGDEVVGLKPTTLAAHIPNEVIDQVIHRLINSLSEYELEGKTKAYGND